MVNKTVIILAIPPLGASSSAPVPVAMESAADFAVLGSAAVENTGVTTVHGGDVGTRHGTEVVGFPPGRVMPPSVTRAGDEETRAAHLDLTIAYNQALAMVPTHDLSGQDLGGLTLLPGVYAFSASADIHGMLTLNGQNNPKAQFVFQIGTTLNTAKGSAVICINDATAANAQSRIFWQVGGSATLGVDSTFEGNILAFGDITVEADASIREGSVLACNGAVTLDSNKITKRDTREGS